MAAGIETSIWLALKSRVDSLTPPYPRAWPGQVFMVPSSGGTLLPYLRIGRVSVEPINPYMDDGNPAFRNGMLIVTLVHPLGQDISVYDQIGANIAAHFGKGTQMPYGDLIVEVKNTPHVQEGYEDNGYWTVPVTIPWRSYA